MPASTTKPFFKYFFVIMSPKKKKDEKKKRAPKSDRLLRSTVSSPRKQPSSEEDSCTDSLQESQASSRAKKDKLGLNFDNKDDDEDEPQQQPERPREATPTKKKAPKTRQVDRKRKAVVIDKSINVERKQNVRGVGYTSEEVKHLLQVIRDVLPCGPNGWSRVEDLHAEMYPHNSRDKDSLKQKFQKLHNTRIPTGDPNCPEEVRLAKHINMEIEDKQESTTLVEREELGFPIEEEAPVKEITTTVTEDQQSTVARRVPVNEATVTFRNTRKQDSTDKFMSFFMMKMMNDNERQEQLREERRLEQQRQQEERRQQQQQSNMMSMMMMTMMSQMLPADMQQQMNAMQQPMAMATQQQEQTQEHDKEDKEDQPKNYEV